jgi:integrase
VVSFRQSDVAGMPISTSDPISIVSCEPVHPLCWLMDGLMHLEMDMLMTSWNVGSKPTRYPGIFKTKNGFRVRVRAVDPRSDTLKEKNQEYEGIDLDEALRRQQQLRAEIREAAERKSVRVRYGDYVTLLLKSKTARGELSTAKGRRTWTDAQTLHLVPHFGDWYLDAIKRRDIEEWKTTLAAKVRDGKLSPNTVNGRLRVLLSTLRSAVSEYEMDYDATRGIKPLDTSAWQTYTEEEPNALAVAEVPGFMAEAQVLFPQHYAQLALGLATGRRPCELRPLRWKGETPDILWAEGVLLVRRSQVIGEASDRTKTKTRLRIPLPTGLMDLLKRHVKGLPGTRSSKSDLLFPSKTGGYQSASCLVKPIEKIAKAAGIKKHLSPYFMRRTFQDLCRAAQVHDFVARAISGHATVEMQQLYSSVDGAEVRSGLAKVISLAGFRQVCDEALEPTVGGDRGGDRNAEARIAS